MTAEKFRELALSLPDAVEAAHMGHPDFRVGGKIFATLGPDEKWGMIKLTPEEQALLIASAPAVFHPASGAWATRLHHRASAPGQVPCRQARNAGGLAEHG